MIDLLRLRQDPENIIALIRKKDPSFDGARLYNLDEEVRKTKN